MAYANRVQPPISGVQNAETFSIPWPSTQDGDILFLELTTNVTIETPTGWTEIASGDINGFLDKAIFAIIADGTESGNIEITNPGGGVVDWAYILDHWRGAASWKISSEAVGNSANPDSPSLTVTPDFPQGDIVWKSVMFLSDDNRTVDQYPANYTGGVDEVGVSHVASAYRELNAETEDPGQFTINNTQNWSAYTIALEPSETVSSFGMNSLVGMKKRM